MTTMQDTGWHEIGDVYRHEQPKVKPPSEQELERAESNRRRQRESIRDRIAKAEIADKQRLEAVGAINSVNARKEAISAAHVSECVPLQRRLAEIEQIQIANIKARVDGDPAIDNERRELLAELRERNAVLEAAIAHQDSLLRQLEAERLDAAKRCVGSLLQSELIVSGRPDLLARMRVTASAVNWANARFSKAQELFARTRSAYARAEMDAAESAVAVATQAAAEALAAVLAE